VEGRRRIASTTVEEALVLKLRRIDGGVGLDESHGWIGRRCEAGMVGVCDGRWFGEPVVHGLWCQRSPICELPESISKQFTGAASI